MKSKFITVKELNEEMKKLNNINLENDRSYISYLIQDINVLIFKLYSEKKNKQIFNISEKKINFAIENLEQIANILNRLYEFMLKKPIDIDKIINLANRKIYTLSIEYFDFLEEERKKVNEENAKYRREKRRMSNYMNKTTRELEYIKRIILVNYLKDSGLKNFEIAKKLGITSRTVNNNLKNKELINIYTDEFTILKNDVINEFKMRQNTCENMSNKELVIEDDLDF